MLTKNIRSIIKKDGKSLVLWQGESGRATGKSACAAACPTEYNQAKYITRRLVTDILCEVPLSSFFTISDFKAYYLDGRDQYYGIMDSASRRPKLGYYAMQTMAWLFDGIELAPDLLIRFHQEEYNKLVSTLNFELTVAAFRRKGVPLFCAYSPELIDLSVPTIIGELYLHTGEEDKLKQPVVIDPIRRNVYSIKHMTLPQWDPGSCCIRPMPFVDYPLFVTDYSIFKN